MIYFLNFVLVLSCFFPLKSFGKYYEDWYSFKAQIRTLQKQGDDNGILEAIIAFDPILEAPYPIPEAPEQYFLSGEVRIRTGDYEGAKGYFTKARDMGFRHRDLEERISFVRKLRTLQEQGDDEEIVRLMAFMPDPDPELLFLIGDATISIGEYERAEEYFTKAIEKQPHYKYYAARAWAGYNQKRYKAALEDITTAIDRSPENSSYWYYFRGIVLLHIYNESVSFKGFDDVFDRIGIAHDLRDGDLSEEPKKTEKSDRPDLYRDYLDGGDFLLGFAEKDFREYLKLSSAESRAHRKKGGFLKVFFHLFGHLRDIVYGPPKYVLRANDYVGDIGGTQERLRSEQERLQSEQERLQSERCRSAVSPSTS